LTLELLENFRKTEKNIEMKLPHSCQKYYYTT